MPLIKPKVRRLSRADDFREHNAPLKSPSHAHSLGYMMYYSLVECAGGCFMRLLLTLNRRMTRVSCKALPSDHNLFQRASYKDSDCIFLGYTTAVAAIRSSKSLFFSLHISVPIAAEECLNPACVQKIARQASKAFDSVYQCRPAVYFP